MIRAEFPLLSFEGGPQQIQRLLPITVPGAVQAQLGYRLPGLGVVVAARGARHGESSFLVRDRQVEAADVGEKLRESGGDLRDLTMARSDGLLGHLESPLQEVSGTREIPQALADVSQVQQRAGDLWM